MEPEWSDFKVLVALARGGSVAAAARVLGLDNSTVSRRLAALEDGVGARLAIRGGREFCWTAEGRTLLAAAEAMDAAASGAVRAVRTAKVDVAGTVRISVPPGFVPVLMRLMVPTLRLTHPLLDIELSGDYKRADLARGEADVAVRMVRPAEPDLVARQSLECGWFTYASRAYLDTHGRPAHHDELCRHRLVLYMESMHRVEPLHWMESYRGNARQVTRVDNLELACQTAAADGGITVLPCFIGDAVPGLLRVFPERIAVNTGWIVYHEAVRDTARVRIVVEALLACFELNDVMFSGRVEGG